MGQIYYDMGLLASADVVEVSTTDLVGQYEGQTGPKTQQALERALGKVLFVDEAYRLADGPFGQQAMDEIVDRITKPQFAQRLIIILAGYDADINRLMSINPGLTSRFPESFQFNSLSAPGCITLLTSLLQKRKRDMQDKSKVEFDLGVLEYPRDDFYKALSQHFNRLSRIASWANARDVDILAKGIFRKVLQDTDRNCLLFTETTVLQCLDQMVTERLKRGQYQRTRQLPSQDEAVATSLSLPVRANSHCSSNTKMATSNESDATTRSFPRLPPTDTDPRDTEVTDEVWSQLQQDKAAAEAREREYLNLRAAEENQAMALRKAKEDEDIMVREVEARRSGHEETRARHEQIRLQRELERRAREEELEKIRQQREQVERNRRREQQAQAKLREMGVCVMGYRWIKQTGGYRCAGGSHWVSDAQLRL